MLLYAAKYVYGYVCVCLHAYVAYKKNNNGVASIKCGMHTAVTHINLNSKHLLPHTSFRRLISAASFPAVISAFWGRSASKIAK